MNGEAQVLASLNHPNIAAIYGLEESGETRALVLEWVEGQTLAERLRGRKEVFLGLYWKRINDAEFTVVPNSTEVLPPVVFSPSSDRLAFCDVAGEIRMFRFAGGLPRTIARAGSVITGAQWSSDDRLLFATKDGLHAVEMKEGSTPTVIVSADRTKGERTFMHPQFLPGLKALIFTVSYTNDAVSLEALDLTTKVRKKFDLIGSYNPLYYAATGHLLYGRDDVLWARPFDPVKLEFTGPEIPTAISDLGRDWGVASHQFSIANNGTLIDARGHQLDPKYQLVWVRDLGEPEVVPLAPGNYLFPRLAPDGKSAVLTQRTRSASETLIVNLANGQAAELAAARNASAFAYDGTDVFFGRRHADQHVVLRARADGSGAPEEIYQVKRDDLASYAISPDGRFLADVRGPPGPGEILCVRKPREFDARTRIVYRGACETCKRARRISGRRLLRRRRVAHPVGGAARRSSKAADKYRGFNFYGCYGSHQNRG